MGRKSSKGRSSNDDSNYAHDLLFEENDRYSRRDQSRKSREQQLQQEQSKEKYELAIKEFKEKFGESSNLSNECGFNYFELGKKLGHKTDGDTIEWLMNQAESAVKDVIGKQVEMEDSAKKRRRVEEGKLVKSKDLEEVCGDYEVNQVWALWDDEIDGMPRVYAQIRKILVAELKIEVSFLEPMEYTYEEKQWLSDKKSPMACGKFKVAELTSTIEILDFSHQVNLERGAFGKKSRRYVQNGETVVTIRPREGEIWAVFKDWNANWTLHDISRARYELVEVVSEMPNEEHSEMAVICLSRVGKHEAVFERGFNKGEIKWRQYTRNQLLQFSHRIPASKLKVEEMEGVPNEAWKLNPAALPAHLI